MNIDLGLLGKVTLEVMEFPVLKKEGFTVVLDGYTESGIRVHGVIDKSNKEYPICWNDAILIKVGAITYE